MAHHLLLTRLCASADVPRPFTVNFSRDTLASFSVALGQAYASRGLTTLLPPELATDQSTAADMEFLIELLAVHRRRASDPGPTEVPRPTVEECIARFACLRCRGLTARECEVVGWIAQGKRDAEIAEILGCAAKTVSKHVERILAKLGAETRLAAVRTASEMLQNESPSSSPDVHPR